jgi:hypothetical protein
MSAAPTPIVIAPITWLRAVFGFRMRPAAQTASIRRTRICRRAIDPQFDEVRAERRLLMCFGQIAVLDKILGNEFAIHRRLTQRHTTITRHNLPIGEDYVRQLNISLCDTTSRNLTHAA